MTRFIAITALILLLLWWSLTAVIWPPHPSPSRPAKISVEISQLSEAVQGYKERHVVYPPCLAEESAEVHKKRFMRHLSIAHINASYGMDVRSFDVLNGKVRETWVYCYAEPDGTIRLLDLEKLDAAEALVFWLGGFPTPVDVHTKQPIAGRKLFGFHRDSDHPFKRDLPVIEGREPLRLRTDPLFDFDQTRLVDQDGDGWWEYVPIAPRDGEMVPPYVYFDADAYTPSTEARNLLGTCFYPRDVKLAARWGTASPYLQALAPMLTRWCNPDGFQVVSAGLDGKYGPPGNGTMMPPARVTVFANPLQTFTAADGFQTPQAADKTEADNLTNLSSRPLGDGPSDSEPRSGGS